MTDEIKQEKYKELMNYWKKSFALGSALTLFSWDTETLAPQDAVDMTSQILGSLSEQAQKASTDPNIGVLLNELGDGEGLSEAQRADIKLIRKEYEDLALIPTEEYVDYTMLQSRAVVIWTKAKKTDSYEAFLPTLKELIAYKKKFAGYKQKDGMSIYDTMLNDFEEGFTTKELDKFFAQLKDTIVPLLKRVVEKNDSIDTEFISRTYPADKQEALSRFFAAYIGFDFNRGVLAQSEHPFTSGFHNHDVRITDHFYENKLDSAIFSALHEGGHGIYEQDIPDELTMTPSGCSMSMGIHESQSRFYENMVGRSEHFWKPLYARLKEAFQKQLEDVSVDKFVRAINKAEPSLIRTESDELTYCLHIMIRYELEKRFIDGDLKPERLADEWRALYKEYLGVEPQTLSEGILQDIHWAQGAFGYFPSYAIGNAIGAQIYHQMRKDLDFDTLLEEERLDVIHEYLRTRVHVYGASKSARDILKELTGEDFNPAYYTEYLKEKYERLYEL